jgi:hypothetical protein
MEISEDMAAVTISADHARSIKALELAASAGQWFKVRIKTGGKAYAIESERRRGVYHLADCQRCTCPAFSRWSAGVPCKHVLAVRLHVELAKAQQARSASGKRARRTSPSPVPRQSSAPVSRFSEGRIDAAT